MTGIAWVEAKHYTVHERVPQQNIIAVQMLVQVWLCAWWGRVGLWGSSAGRGPGVCMLGGLAVQWPKRRHLGGFGGS